jgi:hypothetical protein
MGLLGETGLNSEGRKLRSLVADGLRPF